MNIFRLLLLTLLLSGCTGLFFHPHNVLVDTPNKFGLEYQIVEFKAMDGTVLNAWFLPAKKNVSHATQGKQAIATVLFLHGNAENISTHFRNIAWLPAEGFNVLALDYRGYGASEGTPTLAGMQLDIDAAVQHLLTHQNVESKQIIIFGQSLGGALAIHYAAHSAYRANIRAVISDSAFYDYQQIAREKLASSPLTWLMQWLPWVSVDNDYSPAKSVSAISPLPLLLIHGQQDSVISTHHSQQLFERAREPKELWIFPSPGHTQSLNDDVTRKKLVEFILRHSG